MEYQDILAFIDKHKWTFAKSMPNMPHWYVIRENCDDAEFVGFVKYIQENGYAKKFWSKTFIYLDIGAYTYWSMSNPIEITENMPRIINRTLI